MTTRTLALGGTAYPLILPNIRDPRLHVASVIISIHVLGQVGLGFRVSVPQILAAILTCFVIEVALTFRTAKAFVWPASAMLTGSGVALILRLVGQPADDPWSVQGVEIFAGVAGLSLLTKYVIKYRGSHVFNPSNVGLVAAFLILGSTRVEPLDFWWAPLNPWMALAYALIVVGGLLITRRLKLLALAATYWLTLWVGVGLLAGSGHCMTANWAFTPICGDRFWRVIVTSPEVLIFLFFMITDPKTVPAGRVGRVLFGLLVGIASTLLIAPQTDEWATKVALLGSLVLVCTFRPLIDRFVPEPRSAADAVRPFLRRLALGDAGASAVRRAGGASLLAASIAVTAAGIVVAGSPARGYTVPDAAAFLDRAPSELDPELLPPITVDADVSDWDHTITGAGAQEILITLAENLALENEAVRSADESILPAVDHGDRLEEMRLRVAAAASHTKVLEHYAFDAVRFVLVEPVGVQSGLSLGLQATGARVTETLDPSGALVTTETDPFELTFLLRRATGDRWLNVAVLPGAVG